MVSCTFWSHPPYRSHMTTPRNPGHPLYFEQLNVGDTWVSRGRTVTEADVVSFACLTGDFDPLHVDHEFAARSPLGKPIAHGLLGLSLLAGLNYNCPAVHTLAFVSLREWKFRKPIFFGDTIHGTAEIVELRPHNPGSGLVVWKRRITNQRQEVVQMGVLDTIVACRPAADME